MTGRVHLTKDDFRPTETTLFEADRLLVSSFLFATGVHALRLQSPRGHIVVLPFQGQQIWDALFEGRRLTMKSFFPEPESSRSLLDSYGAFLYHCGALRMGTPGPEDDHPLHGELPAAPYQEAWLDFGEERGEPFVGVSGSFAYAKAFGDKYRALPSVRLYRDRTVLDVSMTIENLTHVPMDLMYMCHVNFLPASNGEIVQAAGWNTTDMSVRSSIPSHVKPTKQYLAFLDRLKGDPGATRVLRPEDEYNPEIVFYLTHLKADDEGMTHVIQKHPDGTSDYVSYNTTVLDHTVRWILKHEDQQVLGMALPATCDPEGYTAEKRKGNVRSLSPRERAAFSIRTGYLDAAQTKQMESKIRSL